MENHIAVLGRLEWPQAAPDVPRLHCVRRPKVVHGFRWPQMTYEPDEMDWVRAAIADAIIEGMTLHDLAAMSEHAKTPGILLRGSGRTGANNGHPNLGAALKRGKTT